jgi:hypothetical protein
MPQHLVPQVEWRGAGTPAARADPPAADLQGVLDDPRRGVAPAGEVHRAPLARTLRPLGRARRLDEGRAGPRGRRGGGLPAQLLDARGQRRHLLRERGDLRLLRQHQGDQRRAVQLLQGVAIQWLHARSLHHPGHIAKPV